MAYTSPGQGCLVAGSLTGLCSNLTTIFDFDRSTWFKVLQVTALVLPAFLDVRRPHYSFTVCFDFFTYTLGFACIV